MVYASPPIKSDFFQNNERCDFFIFKIYVSKLKFVINNFVQGSTHMHRSWKS